MWLRPISYQEEIPGNQGFEDAESPDRDQNPKRIRTQSQSRLAVVAVVDFPVLQAAVVEQFVVLIVLVRGQFQGSRSCVSYKVLRLLD